MRSLHTGELRRLGRNFRRLAVWLEKDPATYDADALAEELEAEGMLDSATWAPAQWVFDTIEASRYECDHAQCVWVDSGSRVALVCRHCCDCSFDASFDASFDGDAERHRDANPEPISSYPENACLTPLGYVVLADVSFVDLLVVGAINGTRNPTVWESFVRLSAVQP
jgi:hypothetical protein